MRFLVALVLAMAPALMAVEQVGRRAPGFMLPDVNVNYHDLADYRGKIILLDFIQTNCPACQTSQPIFERIRQKYPDKVQILAIVVPPDTQASVRAFITQRNVKTPVLFDCGQAMASYFKLQPSNPQVTFPQLFIIDQGGIIRKHYSYEPATEAVFHQLDTVLKDVESLLPAAKPAGPAAPKPPAKK